MNSPPEVKMCRACMLSFEDADQGIDINNKIVYNVESSTDIWETTINTLFKCLTCIDLSLDTPSYICNSCLQKLSECFTFKLQCIKVDLILKNQSVNLLDILRHLDKDLTIFSSQLLSHSDSFDNEDLTVENNEALCPSIEESQSSDLGPEIPPLIPEKCTLKDGPILSSKNKPTQYEKDCNELNQTDNLNIIKCDNVVKKVILETDLTKEKKQVFICNVCGKILSSEFALKKHLRRHSDVKSFECPDCDMKFYEKAELKKHSTRHGLSKFICETCGAKFSREDTLKIHKNVHIGVKPYACSHCPKRFLYKMNCDNHIRVHTGERPFVCSQCEKAFTQRTSLMQHVKTHKAQVHVCNVCQQKFKELDLLKIHSQSKYCNPKVDR